MKNIIKSVTCLSVLLTGSAFAQCVDTNFDAWSSGQTSIPDGTITVTGASAMAGTVCGMEAQVNTSTKNLVADTNPTNEQRYRQRHCMDPNSITMPSSGTDRKFKWHNAQCTGASCPNTGIVQFKLQHNGTSYQLNGFVRDSNSNAGKNKFTVDLADAPQAIEYDVDLTAGTFKLWLNATADTDALSVDLSGLDMAAWNDGVSEARFGQANKPVNLVVAETIFIDEAESRRQTFIGGAACL